MKLTPDLLVSFETEMKAIQTSSWERVVKELIWDRVMKKVDAKTKRQILVWLLEGGRIYPEGDGGNKRFDDMVAKQTVIENQHAGAALELTRDEIEFNQMAKQPEVGALDYARKWATDTAAASTYYPQQKLFELLNNGHVWQGYDGVPFWSKFHPVNPNGGSLTYPNIIENVPIAVPSGADLHNQVLQARINIGKAMGAIRKQRMLNNVPRRLVPRTIMVQSDYVDIATMAIKAGIISQVSNTAPDDRNEVVVIAAPELDDRPDGEYVILVDDVLDDEMGAFIWTEPRPFETRFYGILDDAALSRMELFQWHHDGVNMASYGHPYLAYLCKPGT